jgi:hypothetical protein
MRALAFMTALLFAAPAAAQRGVVSGIRVSTERVSAGAPVTMSITGSTRVEPYSSTRAMARQ